MTPQESMEFDKQLTELRRKNRLHRILINCFGGNLAILFFSWIFFPEFLDSIFGEVFKASAVFFFFQMTFLERQVHKGIKELDKQLERWKKDE